MHSSILKFSPRAVGILAFALMALPAAKNNGCGPSVPIGGDTLGEICGTPNAVICSEGEFCAIEMGCDGEGVCTATPQACTEEYDPVCSCDGATFSNACHANAAGSNVAYAGECVATGNECGGLMGIQCQSGEFCDLPAGTCGAADETGTCTPIPQGCDAQYDPVCGCNDVTYSNACAAAAASTSIKKAGECSPVGTEGAICGGLQGLPCNANLFCLHPEGTCGIADGTGTCTAVPVVCTDEVDPVCGCDQVEYSNACEAYTNSMSIQVGGPCP